MKPKKNSKFQEKITLWLFNMPAFFLIFLFSIIPIAYALYMSLLNWDLLNPSIYFVGFSNYIKLFNYDAFWNTLNYTFVFAFSCVVLVLIIGLALATLLNEELRGTRLARGLSLIPWAIPPVIAGIIWSWAFDGDYGIINYILQSLGIIQSYLPFLSRPDLAMLAVITARAWREVPFATLIILAGLQSIPIDLYEAATVDGAGVFNRFRQLTLPLIRNQILIVLTFETMWSLRAFDEIYAMTAGGPAGATTVLGWFIYLVGFRYYNFGLAAAAAFVLALITLSIAVVYVKVFYRKIEY